VRAPGAGRRFNEGVDVEVRVSLEGKILEDTGEKKPKDKE
jgi:hypothetical protein